MLQTFWFSFWSNRSSFWRFLLRFASPTLRHNCTIKKQLRKWKITHISIIYALQPQLRKKWSCKLINKLHRPCISFNVSLCRLNGLVPHSGENWHRIMHLIENAACGARKAIKIIARDKPILVRSAVVFLRVANRDALADCHDTTKQCNL